MPEKKPILVLQMQRMGDLILSFPMLLWIQRHYPGHPVWVVAEPNFYTPLMALAPQVIFMPWTSTAFIKRHDYTLVVNLSIREQAATLAAEVSAERKIGPLQENGIARINGNWQLYRASLVNNNRYNRYHWADLNALDIVSASTVGGTVFEEPRTLPGKENRIGLFLGASDPAKHPTPAFWAALISELLGRGLRPVLFGGPAEVKLGNEVRRLFNGPVLDYCGKLELNDFTKVGQSLALFITPDTGPMHLAAWTGLKCLNLSMGNVHPWETGPYQPGHFVLRASMDCAKGCWTCPENTLACHAPFEPKRIAMLTSRLAAGDGPDKLARLRLPGLDLFRTGRSKRGMYHLHCLGSQPDEHRMLSRFWNAWFGWRLGGAKEQDKTDARQCWTDLQQQYPEAAEALLGHVPAMSRQLRHGLASDEVLDQKFWEDSPQRIKPLTGFAHMLLQNRDYSQQAWKDGMQLLEAFLAICT